MFNIKLQFRESVKPEDIPTKYQWYLAEADARFAHVMSTWYGVRPFVFRLEMAQEVILRFEKTIEKISGGDTNCRQYGGKEDTYLTCKHRNLVLEMEQKCNTSCYLPMHKTLMEVDGKSRPECTNSRDIQCQRTFYLVAENNMGESCLDPCEKFEYRGSVQNQEGFNNKALTLMIMLNTNEVSVFEKYLLFDLSTFIGSVGGSLGLFIGFSYFDFASMLIDFMANRFFNR